MLRARRLSAASVLVSRNLQPEGADTVVVSGQILEKPQDPRDATEVSPAKSVSSPHA